MLHVSVSGLLALFLKEYRRGRRMVLRVTDVADLYIPLPFAIDPERDLSILQASTLHRDRREYPNSGYAELSPWHI